ncbi:MAG: peptidylprolyl isomerase [Paraprevotella sp.]|nr:peptidylprolyl isomerase [Paraprevotella sp.]
MKRIVLSCLFLAVTLCVAAQTDPVLMRINGKDITRSEFEYNFNKNNAEGVLDKKNLEEYVDLFINYKLKVEAAKDAKYDTLSSFQKEFRMYRDQQIRPLLVNAADEDAEALAYYTQMKESIGPAGLVLPAHIFVLVPQQAKPEVLATAKARIDSIYAALKSGASFEELAIQCSDDKMSARRGGALGWIGPKQTLKEFENVAYSLQKGEMSEPFLSTVGFHIVLMKDRKQVEPYEELKPRIVQFLEQRGVKDKLAAKTLDSLVQASEGKLSVEQIMDREAEKFAAQDSDLKNLIQEYYDGLLLFEISTREVWDKAAKDEAGIAKYFKKNKKKYAWDVPHFHGVVFQCKKAEDVKKVKKLLRRVDEDKWVETLKKAFNNDSVVQIRVEKKLYKKGENSYVDYFALKEGKEPETKSMSFKYPGVYGRVLKKGPAKWYDVRSAVTADYQTLKEQEFVKALREKYSVEVFKDVLETVNKH